MGEVTTDDRQKLAVSSGGGRGIYDRVEGGLPVALRLAGPLARTKRAGPLAGTERTGQSGRGPAFETPFTDSPS